MKAPKTFTAKEITKFLLNRQIQPNTSYHVWASDNGLHLTVNSWEYRDSEHELIASIQFMDWIPSSFRDLLEIVEFQI